MQTSEYRKAVTERLIGMLESGTAPWQKPWDAGIAAMNRPHNFNGRPYHGVNALMLWCTAIDKGYEDPRWLTFKQVNKLGGHVNKGEKAQIVEYWQWEKEVENPETGEKEKVPLEHPKVYRAAVFNADQCTGLPKLRRQAQKWSPVERAENIIAANGVPVTHNTDGSAFYSPGGDFICLPPRESFATVDAYYSTLLHEVGHSTGHPTRLNREFGGQFGSEGYAREELRAELASTFLCGELGIATTGSDEQHAAYVKSWVSALKNDYNEIFRAAADAEKICNYLYEREKEYLQLKEQGKEPQVKQAAVESINDEQVLMRMTPEERRSKENTLPQDIVTVQLAETIPLRGKDVFIINDKIYIGDREYYGNNGLYDNSDNTLEYVSSNPHLLHFVSGREFAYSAESMLKREELDRADFEEYKALKETGVLAKYENIRVGDVSFEGKTFNAVYSEVILKPENKELENMAKDEKSALMPASDAQKGFLVSLGAKFEDDITKGEADRIIKERVAKRSAYFEKINAPATSEQKETLAANNCKFADNITVGEASKIIGQLHATVEQMDYMDKLKISYPAEITINGASKLIEQKMREFEARDNSPATDKQIAALKAHGIQPAENITRAEARAQIYLSPATEKQIKYLNANKIEYDKDKICYGRAGYLIGKHTLQLTELRSQPATEYQLDMLDKMQIKYGKEITKGEAYDIIKKQKQIENAVTEKQVKKAEALGIELPKNATRAEAAQQIELKVRENKIAEFVSKEANPDAYDKYLELANKQYAKTGDFSKIDDNKIAREMLKQGFEKQSVVDAITEHSPVGRDYARADKTVEAAAKTPAVAKAMAKVKDAEKGR
jgi:antirestriction protein ArdC